MRRHRERRKIIANVLQEKSHIRVTTREYLVHAHLHLHCTYKYRPSSNWSFPPDQNQNITSLRSFFLLKKKIISHKRARVSSCLYPRQSLTCYFENPRGEEKKKMKIFMKNFFSFSFFYFQKKKKNIPFTFQLIYRQNFSSSLCSQLFSRCTH